MGVLGIDSVSTARATSALNGRVTVQLVEASLLTPGPGLWAIGCSWTRCENDCSGGEKVRPCSLGTVS